ncbi:MAG: flagellar FlbD family protein [Oscillospiraceae bacterium]|nr:flagellar FlbD family protein [Oscillospiraceae bacterium]
MVELTKLNKKTFFLNSDLVETIESTPDTVITLRNGKLVLVLETPETVIERISIFKRKLNGLDS